MITQYSSSHATAQLSRFVDFKNNSPPPKQLFWGGLPKSVGAFMKNCSFVTKIFLGDIWDTSDIPKRLYDIWECPDEIIDFQKKFCTSKSAFFAYFWLLSILQYFQKVCLGLEKFKIKGKNVMQI